MDAKMGMAPTNNDIAGHDAPVSSRELDDYDRWPIATAISNVISSAPPEWSTRIGLYGHWGDGKTTVLKFVEIQQRRHGNIVLWYSPWGVSIERQLWDEFGQRLRNGLSKHGIKLGLPWRCWLRIKDWAKHVELLIKGSAEAVERSLQISIPNAAKDATVGLIKRYFKISKTDIQRMSGVLGHRRVVVLIDDLDRADPSLVPKLLLALRELLDLPKFVFVLAFDRTVVAKALSQYNLAWGTSGELFIEKIIDFPFELPSPTANQVKALALRHFASLCPFVPQTDIDEVAGLLPSNPRRLKLFARLISSLKAEASRHDEGELDWPTILIFGLLRIESEEFTTEFVRRICEEGDFSWMAMALSEEQTEEQDQKLDKLLDQFSGLTQISRARIRALVKAWQQKRSFSQGERLRYQVYFASRPHNITWGEFKQFFKDWHKNKDPDRTSHFVSRRATAMEVAVEKVADELIETASRHYGTVLERASEVRDRVHHAALIAEASDCLDLFNELFVSGVQGVAPSRLQTAENWDRLVGICMSWHHFTENPGERELRAKEEQILAESTRLTHDPVCFYEAVKPWSLEEPAFDKRSAQLKNRFTAALRAALEPRVIDISLALFSEEGGIGRLFSQDEHLAHHYLLTAPESPIFGDGELRTRLEDAIVVGEVDATVHKNALDYLDLLLMALEHHGRFCRSDDRKAFIAKYPPLIERLWSVVVSSPSQYRFLSEIRDRRQKLIGAGANEANLIEPDWLRDTHTE